MKSNQKIVILTTGLTQGGAERQLSYLAVHLDKINYDVTVLPMISKTSSNAYKFVYADSPVEIIETSYHKNNLNIFILIKTLYLLFKINPKVLLCFNYPSNMIGRVFKIINPKTILITSVRNVWNGSKLRDFLFRITKNVDNLTTFNTNNVHKHFISKKLTNESRSKVILNGVDISKFSQVIQPILKDDQFIWITIGRMFEQKDYKTLILAFKKLTSKYANAVLHIYGDGPLKKDIINLINKNNLQNNIELKGTTNDIAKVLMNSNAFVLSSLWEGLPNVIIEAIASGKPIVSTNVGGVNELVINEYNGYLCESGNPEMLFQKMMKLMELDESTFGFFSKNSLEHSKRFELNQILSNWKETIDHLQN